MIGEIKMEKGINLRIDEFKKDLAKIINESNMPFYVTKMVLSEMLNEVAIITNQAIQEENKVYHESLNKDEKKK
jgi:hypothetical protein